MKNLIRLSAVAAALLTSQLVFAQTATPEKPADATGQCKDGSYSTAASKSGACRGHKGVKEWYAASTPAAIVPPANTAPATSPAKVPTSTTPTAPSPTTQARTQTQAAAQDASQTGTTPPTTSIAKSTPSTTPLTPAAGGGPGMVWVNTSSNIYHCPGTKYYGKTKAGSYMSEADAKVKGAHPDHGNACSK